MISLDVSGLREVDKMLNDLSKGVQKRVLTKALLAGGEIIARSARQKAPRETGFLYEHITVTDKRPDDANVGKAAYGAARSAGLTGRQAGQVARAANRAAGLNQAEVWVGASKRAVAAWPQEVGTINHPAHPFLRPAFDENRALVADTIAFELFDQIQKATARAKARASSR